VKSIEITFKSGRDVLQAYWGFLSNGGLVLREDHGLSLGDPVNVSVTIASSRASYALRGHVVRRPDMTEVDRDRTIIEFNPGEPHDLLLSAAWSETDNTPTRRFKRLEVLRDVSLVAAADAVPARLLNVSLGGCCVTVPAQAPNFTAGSRVSVEVAGTCAPGVVKWRRSTDVGVEFDAARTQDVERFVRIFL
jgi:Tfp pilus assembly protein PilZ